MAWKKNKTEDLPDADGIDEAVDVKPEKAPKEKLSRKEARARTKEVRAERKALKNDLKLNGVKSYADFDFYANDLDLSYPEGTLAAFGAGTLATISKAGRMIAAGITLKSVLVGLAVLLAITFMIAYVSEEKGHFTINLTADMMRDGFQLSDTADFANPVTRLFAKEIQNSNATSIYEINRNVGKVDGSHNGPGYMAQTFYIRNAGDTTTSFGYTVNIISETMNTGNAAWVMFFEDDKQIIYARALEDGSPERLWGYPDPPFEESAYYPKTQYQYDKGKYRVVTTPFIDNETALQGFVSDFEPGQVKKYTCVAWLEGDDPDCNNSIMGGHVGFNIQFDRLGDEEDSYFKGLFRVEYDEYYEGNIDYEREEGGRDEESEAHDPKDDTEVIHSTSTASQSGTEYEGQTETVEETEAETKNKYILEETTEDSHEMSR